MGTFLNPTAFNGQGGNVELDGIALAVREWKFKQSGDPINVTHTAAGGAKVHILGPTGGSGTFRVNADCVYNHLKSFFPLDTECPPVEIAFIFILGTSTSTISGFLLITDAEVVNPASEDVTIEYSFVTTTIVNFNGGYL